VVVKVNEDVDGDVDKNADFCYLSSQNQAVEHALEHLWRCSTNKGSDYANGELTA
jgi:hypothetical protein